MYQELKTRLEAHLRDVLKAKYDLSVENIPLETPPDLKFGELATPIAFELARKLRKAPKVIAQEIVAELGTPRGFSSFEIAGAGYINAYLDRTVAVRLMTSGEDSQPAKSDIHALVEHTSINPNKAAHIGHLRNAILGDTFARLLAATLQSRLRVGVQNYIDNTGVQVADVVVGFVHLEKNSLADVVELLIEIWNQSSASTSTAGISTPASRSGTSTGTDRENAAASSSASTPCTDLEHGGNETADDCAISSRLAVLRRHLETMQRLGIEYDFLPRECEILSLHFWDAGPHTHDRERRPLPGDRRQEQRLLGHAPGRHRERQRGRRPGRRRQGHRPLQRHRHLRRQRHRLPPLEVRLLPGKDFGYQKFYDIPDAITSAGSRSRHTARAANHPHFGDADAIYNVIDSRADRPAEQRHRGPPRHGLHRRRRTTTPTSPTRWSPSRRAAPSSSATTISDEDQRPSLHRSQRPQGLRRQSRRPHRQAHRRRAGPKSTPATRISRDEPSVTIAKQIAVGALRYFMLRFTRNTVIAFDFKDALSFEGETGPYVQYAIVRAATSSARSIITEAALAHLPASETLALSLNGETAPACGRPGSRRPPHCDARPVHRHRRARATSPNTPSSSRSNSTTSTTSTTCSTRRTPNAGCSCWPQPPSPCVN